MKTLFTRSLVFAVLVSITHFINAQSYIIPVVFHVLHEGGSENISDTQIIDALRILNEDYNRQNPDTSQIIPYYQNNIADMQVEFRLATIDPNGNSTNGIEHIYSSLTNVGNDSSKINQWNPSRYLNIWTVKHMMNGLAGYAYYPWAVDTTPSVDGIIMLNNYIGTIGTSSYGLRRALTHEMGHYLCLLHLWGSGLCVDGDSVSDTPPTKGVNYCPPDTTPASMMCTPGVPENSQNFMDYTYCSAMFTNGQKARVHNCLESTVAHRDSLWALPNLIATGVITGIEATKYERLLSLFPNPSTTSFTLKLSSSPNIQTYFQLYDAIGRPVKREEINSETTTIQRSNLPTGIYFWQLQQAGKILERGKLVME